MYVGFVVGLDYQDPRLQPFEAFQQFKNHPSVKPLLEGGEISRAGARTIAAGGWQSIPTPGDARRHAHRRRRRQLNFAKIKGVHQAIRSGMLAARAHRGSRLAGRASTRRWRASPGGQELKAVRNFKPGFKRGLWFGTGNAALETSPAAVAVDPEEHRRLSRACKARRIHLAATGTGWSARCRRATAWRPCSLPATRTMRASRCT